MGRVATKQWRRLTWVLVTGWLLLLPAGVFAQQSVRMSSSLVPELVTVRVTLPEGETIEATAWEGDAVTIRSERLDANLALVPTVQDRITGDVTIDLYPLEGQGRVSRIAGQVERIDARLGLRSLATSLLDIEVTEIRRATPQEMAGYMDRKAERVDLEDGLVFREAGCCVSCGGDTFCGCRVAAGCGSCCEGCCGALAK